MTETKYGKYIITELKPKMSAPWEPKFTPDELIPLLHLDSSIVEGAFYVESGWTMPPFAKESHGNTMITMRFWLFSVVILKTLMIYMPKRKYTLETKCIL